jgi:hypothetical protein
LFIPDSIVQSDAAIDGRTFQSEYNELLACSGLQSTVLQRTPGKIASSGPSTSGIEIVRFCAFAPSRLAHRSVHRVNLYFGIWGFIEKIACLLRGFMSELGSPKVAPDWPMAYKSSERLFTRKR